MEPIRVLHIDEPGFTEMAAAFLEREDDLIDVETATNGQEGLDRLATGSYDCVVSDYDMPGRDGIEFLEAVRETHPELPFILFTGKGSEEVASDAISGGATDYLQKDLGTEQYELLANRIRNAVEQYRSKRQAIELDRIRTLASDVTQALVRATSREEAATRVCEIIAESDPYVFAWIGEIESDTGRIQPRSFSGVDASYLDEITVTVDESPTGRGPGGIAIREGRVAVSQNIAEDPEFEPWREAAIERGYRSAAAVPLEHEGTLYGELLVYAERPHAFDEDERDLLSDLGTNISHAFHSFEIQERLRDERDRRQALFENAPGPVIAGDVRGDRRPITAVNDAFEDVFEFAAETVIGRDVSEVLVPDESRERHGEFRHRSKAGESITAEVERITADGPREFLLHVIPYGVAEGRADGWYAWYTDITAHKEHERRLSRLHEATGALLSANTPEEIAAIASDAATEVLEFSLNGVHLHDRERDALVPVAVSESGRELLGEPPVLDEESLAWRAYRGDDPIVHGDVRESDDVYDTETAIRSEIHLPLGDHGVVIVSSTEVDAFDEADVTLAKLLAATAETALDRTVHEQELRRANEFNRELVEHAPVGLIRLDENLHVIYENPRMEEILGVPDDLSESRAIGEDIRELPSLTDTGFVDAIPRLREGESFDFEFAFESIYGKEVHLSGQAVPLEQDGEFDGAILMADDITERKEREQAIEALHTATRRLMTADTEEEVAELTVEAADNTLDFPYTAVRFREDDRLVPVVVSEAVKREIGADRPVYEVGEPTAGIAVEKGETVVYDDLGKLDDDVEHTPGGSMYVPIGNYGVMTVSDTVPDAFDQADVDLAEILAANAEVALERVERTRKVQ